ncbi:hypothetical protein ACFL1M_01305 [Patescibacteria group bacterium]
MPDPDYVIGLFDLSFVYMKEDVAKESGFSVAHFVGKTVFELFDYSGDELQKEMLVNIDSFERVIQLKLHGSSVDKV